jgi:hypothetical protein
VLVLRSGSNVFVSQLLPTSGTESGRFLVIRAEYAATAEAVHCGATKCCLAGANPGGLAVRLELQAAMPPRLSLVRAM